MEEVILFNKVEKRFGKVCALKDLTFSISKGESVALVGNNGSGKTTTINILCNLIPFDNGEVKIFCEKVNRFNVFYKSKLGILLSPPIFINEFTPAQYLKFICKFQHVNIQDISDRINDTIGYFNIENSSEKRIIDYSSGERMKIALAAAIINNPEILVFDEPFVHLDIQTIDFMLSLINSIKSKKTLFITSHNLDLISKICSRFLIIEEGKIIDDFTPDKDLSIETIKSQIKRRIIIKKNSRIELKWLK
jgi:ABC-2 type transport system ATP-binding protein